MNEEIIKAFKQTELFGGLNKKTLAWLVSQAVEQNLQRNGVLFVAGEESRGLFVIVRGSVRGFRTAMDGREQIIFIEKAPATIAEAPAFDGGQYFSTVAAEEETRLFCINKSFMRRLCVEQPEFALAALNVLGGRVRNLAALVEELSLREVSERLLHLLLKEARERGERKNGEIFLDLNLTRGQIAARIGTVREVVSRNLKRLQAQGLIRFENQRLIITGKALPDGV
jgi:CRP-like cAMP-binding protein